MNEEEEHRSQSFQPMTVEETGVADAGGGSGIHDDSLNTEVLFKQPVPMSAPVPEVLAALAHDDSLELVMMKQRQNKGITTTDSVIEPEAEDEDDARPCKRDLSILPSVFTENENRRNRSETRRTPNPSGPSTDEPQAPSNTITADVEFQVMSPYINDRNEIIIPEATAVNSEDIPSATVVRPDKYALTIAGRKIHFRFLALGVIVIFGAAIALAVTLTKNVVDPDSGDKDIPAYIPSSTPSVSLSPTLGPSTVPSTIPTSNLQAELVEIISNYLGGDVSNSLLDGGDMANAQNGADIGDISNLFSDGQSKRRMALNWLVDDQSKWKEEKEPLPNDEIVERFVLALLYFETDGEEWYTPFDFMTKEHVCKWRGILFRTYRKGVTSCTRGGAGRVKNLTLSENNLRGRIPTEIGLLEELTALNIGLNKIQGDIPSTLGSLKHITNLELNGNDLSGPIDSLARLSNLKILDLSTNEMTGSLMNASNLTDLKSFKVNGNKFSGSVPKSFSQISSLEILHLQGNKLSGNVDFLCKDLPSEYRLDCNGEKPQVACTCCIGCTIVNDTACDSATEKRVTLDIYAGSGGNNFKWELKEDSRPLKEDSRRGNIIAAGGDYNDGQHLNIQLCLTYPLYYYIATSSATPLPTPFPTYASKAAWAPNTPYPIYPPTTPYALNRAHQYNSLCTLNTPNWVDIHGNGCDWYEVNDVQGCSLLGNRNEGDMGLAKDNCCYCANTATSPSTPPPTSESFPPNSPAATWIPNVPSSSLEPTSQYACTNTPGYSDMNGGGCEYYEADANYPQACQYFGESGENGMTPNENCCVCKGVGIDPETRLLQTPPSNSSSRKPTITTDKATHVPQSSPTSLSSSRPTFQSTPPPGLLPTYESTAILSPPTLLPTYLPKVSWSTVPPPPKGSVASVPTPSFLTYPSDSFLSKTPYPTYSPTPPPVGISFRVDGYKRRKIGGNDNESFYIRGNPTSNPTEAPTTSLRPTSSNLPTTATSSPISPTPPSISRPNHVVLPSKGPDNCPQIAFAPRVKRPPPCDGIFELNLVTDAFGMDTSWELIDRNYAAIVVSEIGFASNQTLQFTKCLDLRRCYDFIIKDAWDDGICCQQGNGSYNVSVNGKLIGSGGEFGSSETVFVGGSCGANATERWPPRPTSTPTSLSPTSSPTLPNPSISPNIPPTPYPTTSHPTVTSGPSHSPTSTARPSHLLAPSSFPTPTWFITDDVILCNGIYVALNLTTDAVGLDTSWEIIDRNNDIVVDLDGEFLNSQTFLFTECLHPGGCYDFIIKDARGDGICCQQGSGSYDISVNGRLIGNGGEFGSSETVFVGGSCGVNTTEGSTSCPEDHSLLNVTILNDPCTVAKWEVLDAYTGQMYATKVLSKCLPQKNCYQFTIYENYREWILEYDGDFVTSSDGNFGLSYSTTFGPRC